jgi:two-component system response regulator HydG
MDAMVKSIGRIFLSISLLMALILFVDDDPFTLETLVKAAQLLGHNAVIADNVKKAVQVAGEQVPDLIFTDMRLADGDGISLVTQLKHLDTTSSIPVIILSASPEVGSVEGALAAGAIAYLDKPIRLVALQDIIQEFASS